MWTSELTIILGRMVECDILLDCQFDNGTICSMDALVDANIQVVPVPKNTTQLWRSTILSLVVISSGLWEATVQPLNF